MTAVVIAILMVVPSTVQDTFALHCELQALYDEMTQVIRLSKTAGDVDLIHDVFYAQDFVFVDAEGQRHSWADVRAHAIQALGDPPVDLLRQAVRKVTPAPEGGVVTMAFITLRKVVDGEGRYGRPGAAHTLAEVTTFRDTFVKSATSWKLKMREQIGTPKRLVDKLPREIDDPRFPS